MHEAVLEDRLGDVRVPLALVISAMNCACRSVGKPGKGSVVDVDRLDAGAVAATRMPSLVGVISAPACAARRARFAAIRPRAFEQHVAAGHRHAMA
jgi:hypothetical protein